MLVGYDASRAFINEATGTENYSLNLLRALAKIDCRNRYRVYIRSLGRWDGGIVRKKTRSNHPTIQPSNYPTNFEFVPVGPNRLWTQLGLALETWRNPVDVLFVPAHTLPILRKRKIFKFEARGTKYETNSNFPNKKSQNFLGFGNWDLGIVSNFFSKRTKYVVTMHDLGVEYLPGYHSFPGRYYLDLASKYAAAQADALIAVSKPTKADLCKRYGVNPKKVFVVPEGVDMRFFKPQSKRKVESVVRKYKINGDYVLAVGTVQPRKNLETLITAFSKVCGYIGQWAGRSELEPTDLQTYRPTDLNLVIAGKFGWDYQKILDLPEKLGIGDRVRFLGYVDRHDLPALYTGASVFAAPSLFEGFDLPILEALACGCRVVASDISAHREIFRKVTGPVSRFLPASARSRLKSIVNQKNNVELRAVGNPSTTATRNSSLKTHNSSLPEPMVLVKPKDIGQWTQVLYQYISLYNNRLTLVSKEERIEAVRQVLASEYSWEKAARETLKVFSKN